MAKPRDFVKQDSLSKTAKVLEGCLYGNSVNPAYVMRILVYSLRQFFQAEVHRQQMMLENAYVFPGPLSRMQRKSKTCLPPLKKPLDCLDTEGYPGADWKLNLVKMLLDRNAEIAKRVKSFTQEYKGRHPAGLVVPNGHHSKKSVSSLQSTQAMRARNYERHSKSITTSLITTRNLSKLNLMEDVVFDVDNAYFDEGLTLAERIRVIHSCVLIQRHFCKVYLPKLDRAARHIQAAWRDFKARRQFIYFKYRAFRRVYFLGRLAHWIPLLINKFKERRHSCIFESDKYTTYVSYIRQIQKVARGYLVRKKIRWNLHVYKHRKSKRSLQLYDIKRKRWRNHSYAEAQSTIRRSRKSIVAILLG